MFVLKRNGAEEKVAFDKILQRIQSLAYNLDSNFVDPGEIAQKVITGLHNGITTAELDVLAAETCAYMSQNHPDYSVLAARITVSNLHKLTKTHSKFSETTELLYRYKDRQGRPASLIAKDVYDVAMKNKDILDAAVKDDRDYDYDFFGFKTLERSYLLKVDGKVAERPQHMLMRVSLGIHGEDVDAAIETYEWMSQRYFTHATPTLFNSGTPKPQMSSCFLLSMISDSIDGIFGTLNRCASISKNAGGIGIAISNIRASGAYIRGTNGTSNGLVPMLRVFNGAARYVDQGGGKRKGAFAMYLEPWHADIFDFLDLKKNHGKEEQRARDLFYALWIPDLFMRRVQANGDWTLFCPNETFNTETNEGLWDLYGKKFDARYEYLEKNNFGRKTIKAQALWFHILSSQMETGTPYMMYKDACNEKSNQKNLGTIKCSNLCTEIVEFTDEDEVAVCNLASVALPMFVDEENKAFDFEKLHKVVKMMTRNLNRVIDRNFYPVEAARKSNMRHRPIGLGIQGLADTFMKLKFPYESDEAKKLNVDVFETIYFAACEQSMELAKAHGPYETYKGSPASEGILQYDMWNVKPSSRWNWAKLKEDIKQHGMRNSLLVSPMPTASTAQILGNNESFEPYTQNIYVRRVLSGEFVQINRHLLRDLIKLGLWNEKLKLQLISHNGSVQNIPGIPQEIKELYKTVWEVKQRTVIDMAADRGPYIDQSQSLNIHMIDATSSKLTSMHFHGWNRGLKTGQYYLRTKAAVDAIKFTVDTEQVKESKLIDDLKSKEPKAEYECIGCSG